MAILKKAPSKRRSRGGDLLAVILLIAIVAFIGWLAWQQKRPHKHNPKSAEAAVQIVRPEPARPAIVPSLVLVERKPETGEVISVEPSNSGPAIVFSNPPPAVIVPPVAAAPGRESGPPAEFPRPVRDVLEAQIALARRVISPGSIDGAMGSQTRAALATFQRQQGLVPTRALDTNTELKLTLEGPCLTDYTVTTNDLARLQPLGQTWLAKSRQSALEYETILELVAEKAHSHPSLVEKLNPGVDWAKIEAGAVLKIPNADYPEPPGKAARAVINLSDRILEAFDTDGTLLAHFPCSIAARFEKRPVGELHVSAIAPNPNYTFDPAIFPESPEAQAIGHKLVLQPGPNNPVGVAWIGLDKPGYGMHGTPSPEQIGRTESHGCFRLANWDAAYLLKLVWIGMPVQVVP